jgi:DNA repair protein RadC
MPEVRLVKEPSNFKKANIKSSSNAMEVFREIWEEGTIGVNESMYALFLNRANNTLGWYLLSKGGTSGTVLDLKMLFKSALDVLASSFILCHNHPSGNTQPSEADEKITKKAKSVGELLDIKLLDHLILTEDSYMSFADEGRI